jgi:LysM domain
MAAVTIIPGPGVPAVFPSVRRHAPRGATPRVPRVSRATYLRRRLAVVGLALGLVVVTAEAGAALGGSPLAAPGRRPTVSSVRTIVVRPGDTLWGIAGRLAPGEDPRPVVDELAAASGDRPLVPGQTLRWSP